MNPEVEKAMYDNADKFIELANEISKSASYDNVGLALRYAAARYSAFEASMRTDKLAEEKDKHLQFFAKTFTEMLHKNFDEYIHLQSKNKTS